MLPLFLVSYDCVSCRTYFISSLVLALRKFKNTPEIEEVFYHHKNRIRILNVKNNF